jgi:DNA helicase-2/ATP-dependent DNA helicase PcrA
LPYVVVGGIRFYDRAEIRDTLGYLRLLVNPADDMALRRIVNSPPRGIGKTTLERAAEVAIRDGVPLLAGLERYAAHAQRGGEKIRAFLRLLAELRDEVASAGPADAISLVLDRSGYLRHLETARTPEAEARVENLRELVVGAEDFEVSNAEEGDDRSHLELFLDQVALVTDLDNVDERTDRVSLMTAHSAKGLEFPVVYLVGMEEGLFPHSASARDAEAVEEERRLCYVGMTRAMEHLTLSWAERRRRYGGLEYAIPSRFLSEVPRDLVSGPTPDDAFRGPAKSYGGERSLDYEYSQAEPELGDLQGARVRHPIFGVGTIMQSTGDGAKQKLRIRFEKAGVKTVMVRFANLEFL